MAPNLVSVYHWSYGAFCRERGGELCTGYAVDGWIFSQVVAEDSHLHAW